MTIAKNEANNHGLDIVHGARFANSLGLTLPLRASQ